MINDEFIFIDRRKKNYFERKIRERLISLSLGLTVSMILCFIL